MGPLKIFLSLLIFNYSLLIAEVRYVSHSGSNTPPYLTWETAADSIMSAINISSFGDTIYVANGVYQEQVIMIPGLSLIGAGMDSCIIDTRTLVDTIIFSSVTFADSCLLTGFGISVYFNSSKARGVKVGGYNSGTIILNRIINCGIGVIVNNTDTSKHPNLNIYKNSFSDVDIGVDLFNSDAKVKKNIISTDPNSSAAVVAGILIGGYFYNNKPIIDSNVIYATHAYGIYQGYGAKPVISNNVFILNEGDGLFLGYSDTILVYNNLIYGDGGEAISNAGTQCSKIYNNYIGGSLITGIVAGTNDTLLNNVIANADIGIEKVFNQNPPMVKYNCLWDNSQNYSGFSNNDTTNIFEYPMVINDDSTQGELDFHLQMFSPLIDRGDPDILDKDGTRSDIGLYGGPFGEIYQYQDLAPRAPVNLTGMIDTNYILLAWNKNTEADFSHYNLFRDTTENFTADSTTFAASLTDTFYLHLIPQGIDNLYFKLTAVDNQGNESEPSEELHVFLTGKINNEQFTIDNYRLYQNYPNPFNPSTVIPYRLKEAGYVKLYIYDVKGELVRVLVNQWQEKGYYEVVFKPTKAERGRTSDWNIPIGPTLSDIASGVYLYMIMVSSERNIPVFTDMGKMILLK